MVLPPKAGVPAVRPTAGAPGLCSPHLSNALKSRVIGIDEIHPSGNRVRSRTSRALKKLARSLDFYGQVLPVVVDDNFEIVDGHSVWEALKSLGCRNVWILIVTGRSEPEMRALRLA